MLCSKRVAALAAVLAVAASAPAEAVERSAKNSIFVEGLGAGLAYSLNYERVVAEDVGVRVGLSYFGVAASASDPTSSMTVSVSALMIPVTVSYLGVSSGTHTLELGGGLTPVFASVSGSGTGDLMGLDTTASGMIPLGTLLVGYRLQPVDGGFQLRVGLSPLFAQGFGQSGGFGALPWGYLSLGGSF